MSVWIYFYMLVWYTTSLYFFPYIPSQNTVINKIDIILNVYHNNVVLVCIIAHWRWLQHVSTDSLVIKFSKLDTGVWAHDCHYPKFS